MSVVLRMNIPLSINKVTMLGKDMIFFYDLSTKKRMIKYGKKGAGNCNVKLYAEICTTVIHITTRVLLVPREKKWKQMSR